MRFWALLRPVPKRIIVGFAAGSCVLTGYLIPRPDKPLITFETVEAKPKGSIDVYERGGFTFYEDTDYGCLWVMGASGYLTTMRAPSTRCTKFSDPGETK